MTQASRGSSHAASHARLTAIADEELRWFFDDSRDASDATPTYRQIERWLLALTDHDAGVLKAAYTPGPWPEGLVEELGRLTGIVVRLASAEEGWPERTSDQDLLEARVARELEAKRTKWGCAAFAPYRARATELLERARSSYLRERASGRRALRRSE